MPGDCFSTVNTGRNGFESYPLLFLCKGQRIQVRYSDIFFILLHYAHQLHGLELLFETGKGNKKCCINITKAAESLTAPFCNALLGLHAFTGCDSTSSFKGKGKVKAVKLMEKNTNFQELFMKLGESW
jgi:hypothetical protein